MNCLIVGVDEAGRGPVVGPMVIAGVAFEEDKLSVLARLGVRDSKTLDKKTREKLAFEVLRHARHAVIVKVPPQLIDMININHLELLEIAFIAERIYQFSRKCIELYVDAVGKPEKLASRLEALLKPRVEIKRIIVEERADAKYAPVSAASIVAKVYRDAEVEALRKLYGFQGSGYPTDPATISWLKEYYRKHPTNPPSFVRRSWSTLKRIAPLWYVEKKEFGLLARQQRSLLDYIRVRRGKCGTNEQ